MVLQELDLFDINGDAFLKNLLLLIVKNVCTKTSTSFSDMSPKNKSPALWCQISLWGPLLSLKALMDNTSITFKDILGPNNPLYDTAIPKTWQNKEEEKHMKIDVRQHMKQDKLMSR